MPATKVIRLKKKSDKSIWINPLNQCTCTTLQQQICSFCSNRFKGLYVHKFFIIVQNLNAKVELLCIFSKYVFNKATNLICIKSRKLSLSSFMQCLY